ncbi:MAG: hypothetical protein CNLJKLNK_00697 [Holosporales bacterium]
MFFIILWMLCFDCSASSFLPKVHSVDMMPLDVEDGAYADFEKLVTQGCIPLTEQDKLNFLAYARIKNVNIEEKLNYYLHFLKIIEDNFIFKEKPKILILKKFANGLLYDQKRHDQLKEKIKKMSGHLTDADRDYCKNLFIVLDFLMNKSCALLCDIKKKLPLGDCKLKPEYYDLHIWNFFDFVEDTLPFKRKLNICALM